MSVRIGRKLLLQAQHDGSLENLLSFDLSVADVAKLLGVSPGWVRKATDPDTAPFSPIDHETHPLVHGRLGADHEGSTAAFVFRLSDVLTFVSTHELSVEPAVMPLTWQRQHAAELAELDERMLR